MRRKYVVHSSHYFYISVPLLPAVLKWAATVQLKILTFAKRITIAAPPDRSTEVPFHLFKNDYQIGIPRHPVEYLQAEL
jgi:hypothetical protein